MLYDSGGPTGDYSNNESYTITFTSASGTCIRAVLESYFMELNYDYIYVYDGPNTTSPQIGARINGTVGSPYSTINRTGSAYYALSGSITIKVTSDGATVKPGFAFKIDCPENCVAPPTAGTTPAADNCGVSTPICDFNGYSGNTDTTIYTTDHAEIDYYGLGIFCGGINNNSWLSFIAEATTAVLDVWVYDCQGSPMYPGNPVLGIQLEIFDTDCNTFVPKSNCWSPSEQINGQITATGLIPGHSYLLMIDGYARDNCKYIFSASQGLLVADAGKDQTICEGDYAKLVASGGTSVAWSATPPDPSLAGQSNDFTVWVSPSQTTTYTATVTGSNPSCPGLADVTVYVDAANASYTGLAADYCTNSSASTLTPSPTGGTFSGTGVTGSSFNPTSAGIGTHDVTYTYDYSVVTVFADDFDPSPVAGWTHGATGTDSWATGKPKGGNGSSTSANAHKDPLIDHTSNTDNNVYGQGLSTGAGDGVGGYNNSSTEWLKTPVINCSSIHNTTLSFWRYANFETSWDESYVKISTDGSTWTTLPESAYPTDDHWVQRIINISQWADGQATVYIRWISVSDNTQTYSGWNIDDVKITGVTTGGACTSTTMQSTVVYPISVGGTAIATPATICSGSTSSISVSGYTGTIQWQQSPNGTYSWTNISGATAASYSTPALTVTTYYRAVVTSGSCLGANSTTATVTVSSPSVGGTATVPGTPLCYNSSTTISLSGNAGTIQWQQSANGVTWSNIPGATSASYTSGNLTSTTYFQAVVSNAGCTSTTSNAVTVTVNPTLAACTIGSNQSICSGQTPSGLTQTVAPSGGTGNYTYQWQYSTDNTNWNNISSATGTTYNPASLSTTTYYRCNVTSGSCGNANSNIVTITVNANPIANAGTDQNINNGTNTTLNGSATGGSGSYTYSWTPTNLLVNAGIQNPQTVNLSSTTVYTVSVTDNNTNCSATDQVTIYIIGGTLTVTGTTTDYSVCKGVQVQLNAFGSGGNPGNYQYTWSSNPVGFSSTLTNPTVTPTVSTVYTVSLFDGFNTITDTVNVTVYNLPVANAGSDVSICSGNSTTLNASSSTGFPTLTYTWSNSYNGVSQSVSPIITTTYTLTLTDGHGCTITDAVIVNVNPLPTANAGNDQTVCAGTNVTLTASGGSSYQWSNGVTQSVPFTANNTITYTVTVTNTYNCTATDNVIINVNPLPSPLISGTSSVCQGSTITYSTGNITGHTYSWTITGGTPTSSTSSSVDVTWNNIGTGTINLTETITATTCYATASAITVTVHATPVANAGQNDSLCAGSSVTISAAGSTGSTVLSYSWSNGSVAVSQTVAPILTTNYTVTVTDNFNCFSTDIVTVTVNPNPTADAGNNQNIFNGTSASLSGSASGSAGPYSYVWSPSNMLNNANVQNPQTVNLTSSTVYNITATDLSSGCTATDQVTIYIIGGQLSVIGNATDYSICNGDQVLLQAVPTGGNPANYQYTWISNNSGFTSTLAEPSDYPSVNTVYTISLFDGTNNVTDTVNVIVNPMPLADAGNDTTICTGTSISLTATGGDTYMWNNGVIQGTAFTPITTNTYTVTVTNSAGCSATDNITVTVNLVPTADAGNSQIVCDGALITLIASGGNSYQWNNGITQGTPFVIHGTTTYTVTVTNSFNCSSTDQVTITVNPIPTPIISGVTTVCEGTTSPYSTTNLNGHTYLWNITGGSPATSNSSNVNITWTTSGQITLTETIAATTCAATTPTLSVTVNNLPVANAGADQSICKEDTANLNATASTGVPTLSYHWDNGLGNNPLQTVAPIISTIYVVTVTDGNGCTKSDSTSITILDLPIAIAGSDATICKGASITLDASLSSGNGTLNYLWNNSLGSGSTHTFIADSSMTYIVTITDQSNCTNSDSVKVSLLSIPEYSLNLKNTSCYGNNDGTAAAIINSAKPPITYSWTNGATTQNITGLIAGNYHVTITDSTGCASITAFTIKDAGSATCLDIPTAFTPNADGQNDKWEIKHINLFPKASMEVYNRWGNIIFKSDNYADPQNMWDGKYNGNDLPAGSYVYILDLHNETNPIQGVITIIR